MNTHTENLGARRLHSIIEKIIEDISFKAPSYKDCEFVIDEAYVKEKLKNEIKSIDLSRYLV
jgi:ATP-dependent HslUV protease ATP-binding subunit HslU